MDNNEINSCALIKNLNEVKKETITVYNKMKEEINEIPICEVHMASSSYLAHARNHYCFGLAERLKLK